MYILSTSLNYNNYWQQFFFRLSFCSGLLAGGFQWHPTYPKKHTCSCITSVLTADGPRCQSVHAKMACCMLLFLFAATGDPEPVSDGPLEDAATQTFLGSVTQAEPWSASSVCELFCHMHLESQGTVAMSLRIPFRWHNSLPTCALQSKYADTPGAPAWWASQARCWLCCCAKWLSLSGRIVRASLVRVDPVDAKDSTE